MEEIYKKYLIRTGSASVQQGDGWKPIAQVNWEEDGLNRVKLWMQWCFMRSFPTYEEAEKEGHLFAKKWIDNESNPQNDRASPAPKRFRSARDLAQRLLTLEVESPIATEGGGYGGMRVWEKLQTSLVQFAGANGFTALMRRALVLARSDVPALQSVQVMTGDQMESLKDIVADAGMVGTEAVLAITAHLLGLLATFIGEPLTVRLVRESWPDVSEGK